MLEQLHFPLTAPSANPFGSISPTSAKQAENYFKNDIKMVLDGGACKNSIESSIVGFENGNPVIYRLGSISIEDIESVISKISVNNNKIKPDAPSMLTHHYAPSTETILTDTISDKIKKLTSKQIGVIVFNRLIKNDSIKKLITLSEKSDLNEAATNLYNTLHQLNSNHLDIIIAEKFPDYG